MQRKLLSAIVLVMACAPAAPEPVAPIATTTPPPPPVVKAEAPHATWLFTHAVGRPLSELDLGDKGVLQVGAGGRRWIIAKDATVEPSSVLLAQDLIDVRRDGTKYVFLGIDGTTYVADEPLAAPKTTRSGPNDKARYAIGKSTILGLDRSGTLFRSTDFGTTWSKNKSPGEKHDTVAGLVANARGEVLMLLHPQRAFLSIDDGASWAPIATPGIGARSLSRDANGNLWLDGSFNEQVAKLAGSPLRLEVATGFADLHNAKTAAAPAKKSKTDPRKLLVGTRIVELNEEIDPASKRKKIEVTVAPVGGQATLPFVLAPSASPFTRIRTAGYENNVVVGVYDPEVEPRAVKLFRTADDGKSWDTAGAVEGTEGPAFRLLAGPGWIAVGEMCGLAPPCTPARMKVGTKDWQPIGLPTTARLLRVEYDAPRDRLFILANDGGVAGIYAGKKEGPFTKVTLPSSGMPSTMAVDSSGTLRLLYGERLTKIDAAGKATYVWLPFHAQGVELTGDRGYAWTHDRAWETADGGENWTKVASGASGLATCSSAGCMQGGAVRIGWELPDPQKVLLPSTSQPMNNAPPSSPSAPTAPLEIACKTMGPWKPFKGSAAAFGHSLGGDVRFAAPIGDAGGYYAITVARGTAAPQTINLLLPAPKGKKDSDVRSWSTNGTAGVTVSRYTFSTNVKVDDEGTKKYNPVDVEIGWYVAATGKNYKAVIPKVKPFRIGRTNPSAMTSIVEGGLLFLPRSGEAPLYFVGEDGKTTTLPRPVGPDDYGFTDAVKKGSTLVLSQARGSDVGIVASIDGGKTWSTKVWTLGDSSTLNLHDGKPTFFMNPGGDDHEWGGAISFENLTADPPPVLRPSRRPTLVDATGVHACTSGTGLRFSSYVEDGRAAHIKVAGDGVTVDLSTSAGALRLNSDGSICSDLLSASGSLDDNEQHVVIPAGDPTHGWLLQTKGYSPAFDARPIACTIPQ